jgi:excisionase family DNA binding protein
MSIPSTGLSKYERPHGELGTSSARGPPSRDPFLVTIKEAARLLGIKRTSAYKLIAQKKLKLKKIGRRSLITFESIRELAEEDEEQAT